ncbi:MAG TPA: class I SAM-dependent methyltransferase [Polyangiaceae bacterium]|nr:class I SAM-dependent methyltransferase [Polyangiaceae bacterium]
MAQHPDGDPRHGSYLDVNTHKDMLRDVVRTSAYAEAIRAVVRPGQRVIDFGSGTGVLAIFSARAGARVDAIERTAMVAHAREIARLSGCTGIRFHHTDHEAFHIDGRVDAIVSEWMGHAVFYESMLEPLIALRRRWLAPGGVMLPARIDLECALVTDDELYEDGSFLERRPYGIDFSPIAGLPLRQSRLVTLDEDQVASPYCTLGSLDMLHVEQTPARLDATLVPSADTTGFGLLVWFVAELVPGVALGTGPHHPPTHWRQVFLPFPQPLDVHAGRPLALSISPPRDVEGSESTWAWSVSDGSLTIEVDERDGWLHSSSP